MGGEEAVSIEEAIALLEDLAERMSEQFKDKGQELYACEIRKPDLYAVKNASITLQSLRIMTGVFKEEDE